MSKERAMRQCIKCAKVVSVGWFNDNDRHKSNICKDCRSYYRKHLEYPKVLKSYLFYLGEGQKQIIYAYTQPEAERLLEEKLPGCWHELMGMLAYEPFKMENHAN